MPIESYPLDNFRRWFETFTSRFFGDDACVNAHLRLKQQHTQRTCAEILILAEHLALDERQRHVAEVVALFHDVGRFPQFAEYQTFNDARSVNHSLLGVEILRREGILSVLRREDRQWVETAIEHHGGKSLPAGLTGQALLFSKLIRDADKLDIYRTAVQLYRQYRADPAAEFWWKFELPDEPRVSAVVLETIMNGRLTEHGMMQTLNDMIACKLSWVYDMNFAISLARLRAQGSLEQLLAFLPATPEIERLGEKVLAYVDERAHQGIG
ncbi:MAG: HD domain-containing protein [Planctomycetes bacterium]|nr:HD domain-containing protein [Planctomycetota bacterium]